MKKLATAIATIALIGTPAFAADMAVKAPPPAPAPVSTWTGFYLGPNAGYGWGSTSGDIVSSDPLTALVLSFGFAPPYASSFHQSGGIVGGQVGYNWQLSQTWVAGFGLIFSTLISREAASTRCLTTQQILGPTSLSA
jgi:outer membrane immunogenic protein